MERSVRRTPARRGGFVAVLVTLAFVSSCSDDLAHPNATTSAPAVLDTAPATEPVTEATQAPTGAPIEQLADIEATAWEPTTRSDELAMEIATGPPTVQEAVDAFSVTYLPMPGATPTDLPAGDGIGTHTVLRLIEAARDRLAPEQLAVLEQLDAGVQAWAPLPLADTGAVESTTSAATSTTTGAAISTTNTTTTGAAGVLAPRRPTFDVTIDKFLPLLGKAYEDWHAFKPDLPQTLVDLQISSVPAGDADMDSLYPLQSIDATRTGPVCRIRVFPQLWKGKEDDQVILTAFAHELFHCAQDVWNPSGGFPDWLVEGSANFAAFDLYRSTFAPPKRYSEPAAWFKTANAPLSARTYSAWPLFESFRQFGGDAYSAVKSAFTAGPEAVDGESDPTAVWLELAGLDDLVFRTVWSANDLRSSSFPEKEWSMDWPGVPPAGPHDNTTSYGVRGVGAYVVKGSKAFSQAQMVVTMGPKVGLVLALANDGPLLSHAANGTVAIAEGDTRTFCFDESGCRCPQGYSARAVQMDGRDMVFSFAAQRERGTSDVIAVEWDAAKFCHEEQKTGQHNGDPHLRSFDGLAFDVMAPGEFVVARDDRGDFEVQVRNEVMNLHGTGTSVVALGDGAHRIVFGGDLESSGAVTLAIDGEGADSSSALTVGDVRLEPKEDGNWTATWPDGSGVGLRWNHGWFVSVMLDPDREPHISGLLGKPDDDWRNDLVLLDGTHVDPADRHAVDREFAPLWYVAADASLFDYQPGQTTETFRIEPPSPPIIDDDVTASCAAGLPSDALRSELDACAYDVAVTGDDSFVGVYTQVVGDRVAADQVAQSVAAAAGRPTDEPVGAPATTDSALALAGTLASGAFGRDGVVEELTGTIEVGEGSIILGQVALCAPDRDVAMRVTLRGSDHFNEVHLCDRFGFNLASSAGDEVVPGEAAVWASAGGTYDVRVTTDSEEALVTNVTVSTDPDPTVIDASTALADGFSGRLAGRGDTVVLLLNTGDGSMTWNATGTGSACAAAQYGADVIGGGDLLAIGVCGHAEVVSLGPTGDLTVPFIVYAHTDSPVDVTILPQPG